MYLLTHSLLSSWIFAMKDNPYEDTTTEKDYFQEFLKSLRREPTETTEAMQNGIEFEDLVTAIVEGKEEFGFYKASPDDDSLVPAATNEHKWYTPACQIANIVKGGLLQYKAKKPIEVSGEQFLLYGRLDVLKAGKVMDIKFSKGYERGKYLTSTQHPVYLELIPEASEFTYLVCNGVDVFKETYRRDETPSIYPTIEQFVEFLKSTGLWAVYTAHWEAL